MQNSHISLTQARESFDILVVDDDQDIRELLADYLSKQGMQVRKAADGSQMWQALEQRWPDLLVLDLNLPGSDGLSLCRQMRERGCGVPVIMLTARADPIDRVLGLEIGADDYVPKPFEPRELASRIRTVLRRYRRGMAQGRTSSETVTASGSLQLSSQDCTLLRFANWTLDVAARHLLSPEGSVVVLTSGEFRLLHALAQHVGRVLSRDQLLNLTQGRQAGPYDRSIDLHISRLRVKLRDDAKLPTLLKTVRNEGYVLAARLAGA